MTVHHVIVAEPDSLDPDVSTFATLHHVAVGEGCDAWRQECPEPHLWITALNAIIDDEGTDQDTRYLALSMAEDAEDSEHVWHGQRHAVLYGEWCVPIDGCGFEWADLELGSPPDLPPGVYAATCDQDEWAGTLCAHLTGEPVPDPERFL